MVRTKSKDMITDGLTKVLPKEDFMRFRDQMGLVEIAERIKEQEKEQETDYSFLFEDEEAPNTATEPLRLHGFG